MVIFVIGANCTGKSRFIERNFMGPGYTVLNVYDYQKRTEEDERFRSRSSFEQLFRANEMLKADIVELVRRKQDVVVEQTFFRAIRRIGFVEAIREVFSDIPVEVYVMTPSDKRLWRNCVEREKESGRDPKPMYDRIKREIAEIFEFPNPVEGFSRIYAVTDDDVAESREVPDWTIVEKAKMELRKETEERAEKQAAAEVTADLPKGCLLRPQLRGLRPPQPVDYPVSSVHVDLRKRQLHHIPCQCPLMTSAPAQHHGEYPVGKLLVIQHTVQGSLEHRGVHADQVAGLKGETEPVRRAPVPVVPTGHEIRDRQPAVYRGQVEDKQRLRASGSSARMASSRSSMGL